MESVVPFMFTYHHAAGNANGQRDIGGQPPRIAAVRLDPAGGRFASPDAIEWLDIAKGLSCGWRPPSPAIAQFTNWLERS